VPSASNPIKHDSLSSITKLSQAALIAPAVAAVPVVTQQAAVTGQKSQAVSKASASIPPAAAQAAKASDRPSMAMPTGERLSSTRTIGASTTSSAAVSSVDSKAASVPDNEPTMSAEELRQLVLRERAERINECMGIVAKQKQGASGSAATTTTAAAATAAATSTTTAAAANTGRTTDDARSSQRQSGKSQGSETGKADTGAASKIPSSPPAGSGTRKSFTETPTAPVSPAASRPVNGGSSKQVSNDINKLCQRYWSCIHVRVIPCQATPYMPFPATVLRGYDPVCTRPLHRSQLLKPCDG
jgi:hypothetical protein